MIRFDDITYSYPSRSGSVLALCGVSLTVEEGERLAILGPNGSGKSTLARLANGLLLPCGGEVLVDGMLTSDVRAASDIRRAVGLVTQDPESSIVATTVEDDVAFGPENLGLSREEIRSRVDSALERVGMTAFARREPHTLSGGQKQRLAIAGVLALGPKYVVLDEPTSMLDPVGHDEVLDTLDVLAASGTAIMHITHDLRDAIRADRAIVLSRGVVVFEGDPRVLLDRPDDLRAWSLAIPDILKVAIDWAAAGVALPGDPTEPVALLEALCRS